MDWKTLLTVLASVFVAEPGDKTQLVIMLFAADKEVSKWVAYSVNRVMNLQVENGQSLVALLQHYLYSF